MLINVKLSKSLVTFTFNDKILFKGLRKEKKLLMYNGANELISETSYTSALFITKASFFVKLASQKDEFTIHFKAYWSPRFDGKIGKDEYQIVLHLGLKTSIFRNQIQIGYLEQTNFHVGSDVQFTLIADDDLDYDLVCTLAYLVIVLENPDDADINLSLGRIGFEVKKFDYSWKPITRQS